MNRRVDWLLVRAQIDGADFELRVTRPWARDPGLAVDLARRVPHAEIPADADEREALRRRLESVPVAVERARRWLTDPSSELAGMAVFQLTRSDGVNQGEPRSLA